MTLIINLMAKTTLDALDLPFDAAIRFFRDKANVKTEHWNDVYKMSASRAFWVAGAATDALVEDFRKAIDKAISQGTTLDEFRKDFKNIVAKNGWTGFTGEGTKEGVAWRTKIIYDTNLRAAYAAGRYDALTRKDTKHVFPYWQYHHSGALHARLDHLAWDGLVLRADDSFWASHYPPNGWHCGCYVTPVSEAALKRQGKTKPDDAPLGYDDQKGIDKGFAYNIGQMWLSRTAPGNKTMAAAPKMIERFVESAIKHKDETNGYMPVALAPKHIASFFNLSEKTEIRLSANTINRHLHHPETTAKIYSNIVEYAVSEGRLFIDKKGRLTATTFYENKLWLIGLKRTAKNEIYVTTLHYSRNNKINQLENLGNELK